MYKKVSKQLSDSLSMIKGLDTEQALKVLNGFNYDTHENSFDFHTPNATATMKRVNDTWCLGYGIEIYDNKGLHIDTIGGV